MRKALGFIVPVAVCFLVGMVSGWLQSDSLQAWYPFLDKPALTPPDMVFPVAWGILYLLMGLSLGLIINTQTPRKRFFCILFGLQLLFNFTWSVVFFACQSPLWGLVNIFVLDGLVIYYAIASWRENRVASLLFWPYVLWLIFATYLNAYIFMYN